MRYILTILSLFVVIQLQAQSFEGIIKYKMTISNPNPELRTDEQFYRSLKGEKERKIKIYFKNNQYKWYNSTTKSYEHYDPDTNQIFYYTKGGTSAKVVNALEKHERVTDVDVVQKGESVKGILCSTFVIEAFKAVNKYHYNPNRYKVDKKLYKRHEYGHLSEYFQTAGAIPLKIEMKNFTRHVTWEVVKIKSKKISDKHFALPLFNQTENAEFVFGSFNLYAQP